MSLPDQPIRRLSFTFTTIMAFICNPGQGALTGCYQPGPTKRRFFMKVLHLDPSSFLISCVIRPAWDELSRFDQKTSEIGRHRKHNNEVKMEICRIATTKWIRTLEIMEKKRSLGRLLMKRYDKIKNLTGIIWMVDDRLKWKE